MFLVVLRVKHPFYSVIIHSNSGQLGFYIRLCVTAPCMQKENKFINTIPQKYMLGIMAKNKARIRKKAILNFLVHL